jgi:hypothetical protein
VVHYVILLALHIADVLQVAQAAPAREANVLTRLLWRCGSLEATVLVKGLSVAALYLVDEWLRRRHSELLLCWRTGVCMGTVALWLVIVFNQAIL